MCVQYICVMCVQYICVMCVQYTCVICVQVIGDIYMCGVYVQVCVCMLGSARY